MWFFLPPFQGSKHTQGILTSFLVPRSWQLVLFKCLRPQWFLYSSCLPRHEFKRVVAPSPAALLLIHGETIQELDMEMELLPFMRGAVVFWPCAVLFVLSLVPSGQSMDLNMPCCLSVYSLHSLELNHGLYKKRTLTMSYYEFCIYTFL